MLVKTGVQLNGVHYLMLYAAAVVDYIRQSNGWGQATISGGLEGADVTGPQRVGGEHSAGIALDFRTRDLPGGFTGWAAISLADQVRRALGPTWEVILESDHMHVDLHPGTLRA